jgi:hypothetical protein
VPVVSPLFFLKIAPVLKVFPHRRFPFDHDAAKHSCVTAVGVIGHVVEGDVKPFEIVGRDVPKVSHGGASYQ